MKTLYDLAEEIYVAKNTFNTKVVISNYLYDKFIGFRGYKRSHSIILLSIAKELSSKGEFDYNFIKYCDKVCEETYSLCNNTEYKDIVDKIKTLLCIALNTVVKDKEPLIESAYSLAKEVKLAHCKKYIELIDND